jgi:hypothetical protein
MAEQNKVLDDFWHWQSLDLEHKVQFHGTVEERASYGEHTLQFEGMGSACEGVQHREDVRAGLQQRKLLLAALA